jgi:integrase
MTPLLDGQGRRKYLTTEERRRFVYSAIKMDPYYGSFCLTVALTGARISEVLNLRQHHVDAANGQIILETLKRRRRGIFRSIPVPDGLIDYLANTAQVLVLDAQGSVDRRLWTFSRPTGWKKIKQMMQIAGVPPFIANARALRHSFAVEAVQNQIALSVIQRWLGHAKIESTALYAAPLGAEERRLAKLLWTNLPWD